MIQRLNPLPRRSFLQKGIGVSALFLLKPEKLSFILSQPAHEPADDSIDAKDDVFPFVVQRYGSEFGDVKPSRGRQGYGRV